jgi:hypothetical protein
MGTPHYSTLSEMCFRTTDVSLYRLPVLFWFFLLYTGSVPFELVDSAALLWWRGTNSISKLSHHNRNGGAVDNT